MGQTISFKRPDGQSVQGYLAEPGGGSGPGVVVIQEWWGLNGQIKGVADRMAAAGYRALVPDLYRGKVTVEASRQMAGEASEAVARRTRTPPDSLGGHVDPWGPYAPRGHASATHRPTSWTLWFYGLEAVVRRLTGWVCSSTGRARPSGPEPGIPEVSVTAASCSRAHSFTENGDKARSAGCSACARPGTSAPATPAAASRAQGTAFIGAGLESSDVEQPCRPRSERPA